MRIYFRGIQMLVPQDLLHSFYINYVLQHKSRGRVAELV